MPESKNLYSYAVAVSLYGKVELAVVCAHDEPTAHRAARASVFHSLQLRGQSVDVIALRVDAIRCLGRINESGSIEPCADPIAETPTHADVFVPPVEDNHSRLSRALSRFALLKFAD